MFQIWVCTFDREKPVDSDFPHGMDPPCGMHQEDGIQRFGV